MNEIFELAINGKDSLNQLIDFYRTSVLDYNTLNETISDYFLKSKESLTNRHKFDLEIKRISEMINKIEDELGLEFSQLVDIKNTINIESNKNHNLTKELMDQNQLLKFYKNAEFGNTTKEIINLNPGKLPEIKNILK